jgi:hypothetical protein
MIRLSRVFLSLSVAVPLCAQPPEIRNEKGEYASLRYVLVPKPEVNGYFNAFLTVSSTEINDSVHRFIDMQVSEGSYDWPYRTIAASIHTLLPQEALKVTGTSAVFEYDFTGKPGVFVYAYEYDATGHYAPISYQPGPMRLTFTKNGFENWNNTGTVVGNWFNLEIKSSGHWTTSSVDVAGAIFGNAFSGVNNGVMGTRHSNSLQRTWSQGPVPAASAAPQGGGN